MTTAAKKANLTHQVYCHKCPINPGPTLLRCDAIAHGSPRWGALWHCAEHAKCDICEHGSWCDEECDEPKVAS
jgi:hypothetical protein